MWKLLLTLGSATLAVVTALSNAPHTIAKIGIAPAAVQRKTAVKTHVVKHATVNNNNVKQRNAFTKKMRQTIQSGLLVKSIDFSQHLRVCNAYPSNSTLEVTLNNLAISEATGLKYKKCVDVKAALQSGDKLSFSVDESNTGSFVVTEVPNHDAILLLVIHRHDSLGTSVAFESHVFANLLNSQIAVIDTYKSPAARNHEIRIEDVPDNAQNTTRSEELRFNSVVAVNPGNYRMSILDGTKRIAAANLTANAGESYVVLRVGVDAEIGNKYPEELLVFPSASLRLAASLLVACMASLVPSILAFVL